MPIGRERLGTEGVETPWVLDGRAFRSRHRELKSHPYGGEYPASTGAPGAMTLAPNAARTITVASVPSGHVYVRHLSPVHDDGRVRRLPDPTPTGVAAETQQWWPPVMLDPGWAATADFDLFHLHFGFDASDPDRLRDLVDVLRRRRKPLVYTAHDLRNPHHLDRGLHDAHLDVIIPAADAVITLTSGAAAEIQQRWGVRAVVIPHPHVVPLPDIPALQGRIRSDQVFRVGVHLKSVRPGMAPMRVLPGLIDAVGTIPGGVLQVNVHRDVMEAGERHDPELAAFLRWERSAERIELHVHDFMTDEELFAYLASLDVSVLPYRFGTHSGWLEACLDVGTAVVAPSCGYYADQGPVHKYLHEEDEFSAESLHRAVREAAESWTNWHVRAAPAYDVTQRSDQRQRIADLHELLYRSLLERVVR